MQYVFARCVVIVDAEQQYVETRFDDGTKVGSTPNHDAGALALADRLGYGCDTWSMSRDHEIAHHWLAQQEGQDCSRTMWRLAHPYGDDVAGDDEVAEEEARVLALQAALDKRAPRPWDLADPPSRLPGLPW